MKKALIILFFVTLLTSCDSTNIYGKNNSSNLDKTQIVKISEEANDIVYQTEYNNEMNVNENLVDNTVDEDSRDDRNVVEEKLKIDISPSLRVELKLIGEKTLAMRYSKEQYSELINVMILKGINNNYYYQEIIIDNNFAIPYFTIIDYVKVEDYNFDGYLDISIRLCQGGSIHNQPTLFWLWNSDSNQFIESSELSQISWDGEVRLNKVDNEIEVYAYEIASSFSDYYVWQNKKLLLIRMHSFRYETNPNNPEKLFGRHVTRELINNEFVITEDIISE